MNNSNSCLDLVYVTLLKIFQVLLKIGDNQDGIILKYCRNNFWIPRDVFKNKEFYYNYLCTTNFCIHFYKQAIQKSHWTNFMTYISYLSLWREQWRGIHWTNYICLKNPIGLLTCSCWLVPGDKMPERKDSSGPLLCCTGGAAGYCP